MAGSWQQYQVYDGTYDLSDLMDWHEMWAVKSENQLRANEASKRGGE